MQSPVKHDDVWLKKLPRWRVEHILETRYAIGRLFRPAVAQIPRRVLHEGDRCHVSGNFWRVANADGVTDNQHVG